LKDIIENSELSAIQKIEQVREIAKIYDSYLEDVVEIPV
jgi:hypothetical protein